MEKAEISAIRQMSRRMESFENYYNEVKVSEAAAVSHFKSAM